MYIGLYFGSFNPIHTGHLIIAKHILNETEIENIWFIVSPQNPLKKKSTLLNEQHRYNLIQTAIKNETDLKVSNVEFNLPKPSYTIDTLTYLSEKYNNHTFSVIMGSDSLMNISKWKNYKTLINNYTLIIYERIGVEIPEYKQNNIKFCKAPFVGISSTQIRKLIKENKSISYLVPEDVKEEIERNNYYR